MGEGPFGSSSHLEINFNQVSKLSKIEERLQIQVKSIKMVRSNEVQ